MWKVVRHPFAHSFFLRANICAWIRWLLLWKVEKRWNWGKWAKRHCQEGRESARVMTMIPEMYDDERNVNEREKKGRLVSSYVRHRHRISNASLVCTQRRRSLLLTCRRRLSSASWEAAKFFEKEMRNSRITVSFAILFILALIRKEKIMIEGWKKEHYTRNRFSCRCHLLIPFSVRMWCWSSWSDPYTLFFNLLILHPSPLLAASWFMAVGDKSHWRARGEN